FQTDAGAGGRGRVVLEAIYTPAKGSSSRPAGDKVHWVYGDGASADTGFLDPGQDYGQGGLGPVGKVRNAHAFRPGRYTVTVSATTSDGQLVSWRIPVRVFPRLTVRVVARWAGSRY